MREIVLTLIRKIKNFKEKRAIFRKRKLHAMYFEIRGVLIKFYECKQRIEGKTDIPAFMLADDFIKKHIKNDKDIVFCYKKCLKYGICRRV